MYLNPDTPAPQLLHKNSYATLTDPFLFDLLTDPFLFDLLTDPFLFDPEQQFRRLVTDTQESRAMIARSRTNPIGRQGPASSHGRINAAVDLREQFRFGKARADHSAQWTWPIQGTLPYHRQILASTQPAE
jgi:hypothetical protein